MIQDRRCTRRVKAGIVHRSIPLDALCFQSAAVHCMARFVLFDLGGGRVDLELPRGHARRNGRAVRNFVDPDLAVAVDQNAIH